ncbi:hypothetical protein [Devosia crocina]|nr:hypothetical protein [Devosia crocina]
MSLDPEKLCRNNCGRPKGTALIDRLWSSEHLQNLYHPGRLHV